MTDVQYVVFVKPRADLGYFTSSNTQVSSFVAQYDTWVVYGTYRSIQDAKRVCEELIKKVDSDSIMVCKKVDKKMVLTLG
jgi:hypothetical protein